LGKIRPDSGASDADRVATVAPFVSEEPPALPDQGLSILRHR
jgi:hypothetical protein